MKRNWSCAAVYAAAVVIAFVLIPSTAQADIVYVGPRQIAPANRSVRTTVLALQNEPIESGGVRRVNGEDQTFGDVTPGMTKTVPFADIAETAGVTDARDLGTFLDIKEPGNDDAVTIQGRNSLVVTAYSETGTVLGEFFYTGEFRELSTDGGRHFVHVFALDSAQAATLQALINANPDLRLGLQSTLGSSFGGAETFFFDSLTNP